MLSLRNADQISVQFLGQNVLGKVFLFDFINIEGFRIVGLADQASHARVAADSQFLVRLRHFVDDCTSGKQGLQMLLVMVIGLLRGSHGHIIFHAIE